MAGPDCAPTDTPEAQLHLLRFFKVKLNGILTSPKSLRGFSFPLYHEKKTIVLGGGKISTDKGWEIFFFCFSKENPPHTLERVNQLIKKKRPMARSLSEIGRVRVAGRSAPAQRVHPRSLLPPAPRNSTNRLASGNSHPEAQWTMGQVQSLTPPLHTYSGELSNK